MFFGASRDLTSTRVCRAQHTRAFFAALGLPHLHSLMQKDVGDMQTNPKDEANAERPTRNVSTIAMDRYFVRWIKAALRVRSTPVAPPATPSPTYSPLRVLVLHGWGQNGPTGEVLLADFAEMLATRGVHLTFATAPHRLPLTITVNIEGFPVEVDAFPPGWLLEVSGWWSISSGVASIPSLRTQQ